MRKRLTKLVKMLGGIGGARAAFRGWDEDKETGVLQHEIEGIPGDLIEKVTLRAGDKPWAVIVVVITLKNGKEIVRTIAEV